MAVWCHAGLALARGNLPPARDVPPGEETLSYGSPDQTAARHAAIRQTMAPREGLLEQLPRDGTVAFSVTPPRP